MKRGLLYNIVLRISRKFGVLMQQGETLNLTVKGPSGNSTATTTLEKDRREGLQQAPPKQSNASTMICKTSSHIAHF